MASLHYKPISRGWILMRVSVQTSNFFLLPPLKYVSHLIAFNSVHTYIICTYVGNINKKRFLKRDILKHLLATNESYVYSAIWNES